MARLSKPDMLARMGAHVLEHGIASASLRPLAKAAGTSDRMLIYHFVTKDSLIAEVLGHLATDFTAALEAALPAEPQPTSGALLREIIRLLRGPDFDGYIKIWLDIVAASKQGDTAFATTGGQVAAFFVAWLSVRLPQNEEDAEGMAKLLLTLLEGAHALDAVGRSDIADAAIAGALP